MIADQRQTRRPGRSFAVAAAVLVAAQLAGAGPGAGAAWAEADPRLAEALREGGKVIFIRHATTEEDYADQVKAVMGNCATQRALSEAGWHEAQKIGGAIADLGIPVGKVISSEYCRAWQTASLAFGRYEKNPSLNFQPAEDYSEAQIAAMKEAMSPLLAARPADGTNTVLVGHDDPFEAATGIYPEPMGVAYVVEPDGRGGFTVLGNIPPTGWSTLAK
jgi:phosphohistidine phosphatase SixA